MIISVDELRKYVETNLSDYILESKLAAIEQMIRKYTNNNFQNRAMRCLSEIADGAIIAPSSYFEVGDTVEITQSPINNGLYVIDSGMALAPTVYDCYQNLITKVVYPHDVKMGAVNLVKWDIENRGKIGVQSETISRHSVTYFNMEGNNAIAGYPKSLISVLEPYRKARF